MSGDLLLLIVLLLPLAGFLVALLLPRHNENLIRNFTLAVSSATFAASLGLISTVLRNPKAMCFVIDMPWIEYPAIRFHIGVDGLSLWLVILSTLLMPICVLVSWSYIQKRVKEFYAMLLLLLFGLIGVFIVLDFFLFYVFWELTLVPMFLLIGIWGHENRIYAAVKFFLYTFVASVFMLIAIIYLYNKSGTFDMYLLLDMIQKGRLAFTSTESTLLFLAFFIAFAVKVPLFPFHTWLPDAHGEAPTAGSVMLASVMLKMGCYGLVRVSLPFFPESARAAAPWINALAVAGIIYGALVAMVQPNMKRLVAYSSVSHLGFVVLGIFSFTQIGLDGAVYQMLNHGISTGALFILVGYMYERRHSLEISDYGGVATAAPWLSTVFVVTTLASVGLPLLNNFVGEFMVLLGVAQWDFRYAIFAAIGVILSAVYMLWMVQRVFYGEVHSHVKEEVTDLNTREWAAIAPLVVLMVWMGVYSSTFLPVIGANNEKMLQSLPKPPGGAIAAAPVQGESHAR